LWLLLLFNGEEEDEGGEIQRIGEASVDSINCWVDALAGLPCSQLLSEGWQNHPRN
jgi:hypothetical protein